MRRAETTRGELDAAAAERAVERMEAADGSMGRRAVGSELLLLSLVAAAAA